MHECADCEAVYNLWNGMVECNTGMAFYHNANNKVIISNVEF